MKYHRIIVLCVAVLQISDVLPESIGDCKQATSCRACLNISGCVYLIDVERNRFHCVSEKESSGDELPIVVNNTNACDDDRPVPRTQFDDQLDANDSAIKDEPNNISIALPDTTVANVTTTEMPTTLPMTTAVPTSSTVPPTETTTEVPTETPETSTAGPTTLPPTSAPRTTTAPTAVPSPHIHFHAPSFVGGIVLTVGILAIVLVAYKFYKARTERNYHTLYESA